MEDRELKYNPKGKGNVSFLVMKITLWLFWRFTGVLIAQNFPRAPHVHRAKHAQIVAI